MIDVDACDLHPSSFGCIARPIQAENQEKKPADTNIDAGKSAMLAEGEMGEATSHSHADIGNGIVRRKQEYP
jgi:hypothetical protein